MTAKGHYKNITAIQCIPSGEAGNLAFTGDTDGSDNFAKIKEALGNEDDTSDLINYPAFEFAINYKDKDGSHVKGTAYETGWYLPTVAELYDIHNEIETVDGHLKNVAVKHLPVQKIIGRRTGHQPNSPYMLNVKIQIMEMVEHTDSM